MPHRQFLDASGTLWTVWDVHPSRVQHELDLARAARHGQAAPSSPRPILRLDGPFAAGWLCFESGHGKRRLAPIPTGWDQLPVEHLAMLCDTAASVRKPEGERLAV